jgi:hypothetical protein
MKAYPALIAMIGLVEGGAGRAGAPPESVRPAPRVAGARETATRVVPRADIDVRLDVTRPKK